MVNILIHERSGFNYAIGGIVVQYKLCQLLRKMGANAKIISDNIPNHNKHKKNSQSVGPDDLCKDEIWYNPKDFPIVDDNTVVFYPEIQGAANGVGNPLGAKKIVRWILCPIKWSHPVLGKKTVDTWGKNDLVYYFNPEEKFEKQAHKIGNIFKCLTVFHINPKIKNLNKERKGSCYMIRKGDRGYHTNFKKHPTDAFEIGRVSLAEAIKHFNNHKYFFSYDPLTFYTVIAALCGCISVVMEVPGMNKEQWIAHHGEMVNYFKNKKDKTLYGIAYGMKDIKNAEKTIHLVKQQWDEISKLHKDTFLGNLINDLNNWNKMQNTVKNNFY
tara:strand:+ start:36 stop:1019 length:984 start_codon:yes stop_codon:yes gene_type:complete